MKPTSSPLARRGPDVLDWDQIDRRDEAHGRDPLGLTPSDRQILGLTPMRPLDLTVPSTIGAEAALADLLAQGAAVGKRETKRRLR